MDDFSSWSQMGAPASQAPQGPQPYPAMRNSYGLGATPQAQPMPQAQPNTTQQSNPMIPTNEGSRGFNPFSLQGAANTRNPWGI